MSKKTFLTLDALRGIAALFVLTRHTRPFWGTVEFFHSYLAVDLFFLLSGFVLSHAYDKKLVSGELSVPRFVTLRLIRLYPLYLLATLFAAAQALLSSRLGTGELSTGDVGRSLLLTLVFLPSHPRPGAFLFPLNLVYWSLFYEVIVNLLYALARPRLTDRALTVTVALGGAVLAICAWPNHGLDLGFSWGVVPLVAGLARTVFGFGLGLLLHRRYVAVGSRTSSFVPVALLCLFLALPDLGRFNLPVDAAGLLLLLPTIVWLGARSEPGAGVGKLWAFLGIISYPLYVLHVPLRAAVLGVAKRLHVDVTQYAPWAGVALTLAALALSFVLARLYDTPVRARLTKRFLRAGAPPPQ